MRPVPHRGISDNTIYTQSNDNSGGKSNEITAVTATVEPITTKAGVTSANEVTRIRNIAINEGTLNSAEAIALNGDDCQRYRFVSYACYEDSCLWYKETG